MLTPSTSTLHRRDPSSAQKARLARDDNENQRNSHGSHPSQRREGWSTRKGKPNGNFRSDNLVSNEIRFQDVIPALVRNAKPGGIYIGVGPEQNFTYIASLRPRMAFIVDVRRGNVDLHLMYKALFELSADRADFVSRLLSRRRPEGLTQASTADQIFSAFSRRLPRLRRTSAALMTP